MDADGTTDGFDLEMIEAVRRVVDVPVIASGGAGTVEHFVDGRPRRAPTPCWRRPSSTTAPCASPT